MLIDAGNSRLKWMWYESGVSTDLSTTISFEDYQSQDKIKSVKALLLDQVLDQKPARIRIVHVLGESFEYELHSFCVKHKIHCDVVLSTAPCCGVTNGYEVPKQLGADRWVALIGAHQRYPDDNLIVIDTGTAVTIDGLDDQGQHLGGVIMPGLQLWSDTLIKNTQLSTMPVLTTNGEQVDVFATSTKRGVNSGSLYGLAGAIEHVCHVMEDSTSTMPTTSSCQQGWKRILCGGNSRLIAGYIANKNYILLPDLVMHGLIIIEKNNA